MKKFFVLLKKEIRELLTAQMLIPMLFTVVLFLLVGNLVGSQTEKSKSTKEMAILDLDQTTTSAQVVEILKKNNITPIVYKDQTIEKAVEEVPKTKAVAMWIIPNGFENGLAKFEPQKIENYALIKTLSFFGNMDLQVVRQMAAMVNQEISNQLLLKKTTNVDPNKIKQPILISDHVIFNGKQVAANPEQVLNAVSKQMTFIPIILFIVIVFASQMIATAMATEKENKTLETLLSTPVNRQSIVFAKLVGAGLVSLVLVLIYIYGFRYYMNSFMGISKTLQTDGTVIEAVKQLGLSYTYGSYALLGISLFLGIVTALAIAMILGSFVEDVKSVQGVITPLMILVALPYFVTMFADLNSMSSGFKYFMYAIPFSHPFLTANNLLLHKYTTVGYEIVYQVIVLIIFIYLASKLFASDKILTIKLSFKKKR